MIAVTGATGAVGGAVARYLAEAGDPIRMIVRDPSRAPQLPGAEVATATYSDGAAMQAALVGVQTLFLVSASEDANRVALHKSTVDAAVAAGVERIVYTSFCRAAEDATFTFARDHWHTEQHIRDSGLRFVFLRDNLYLDSSCRPLDKSRRLDRRARWRRSDRRRRARRRCQLCNHRVARWGVA